MATLPDAFSHEGDRSEQEDAFLTACREDAVLCAVCDGIGGWPSARPAADLVVTLLREAFEAGLDPSGVFQAIQSANGVILDRSEAGKRLRRHPEMDWVGIGTTASAALFLPGHVHLAHVGDGRIYRLRARNLERLTVEHDLQTEAKKIQPAMSAEEIEKLPQNVLLRVIGMQQDLEVDRAVVETQPGDIFLLCSDGLFRRLPDDAIADLLLQTEGEGGAARTLVEAALGAPLKPDEHRDNVTAVVYRVDARGL